MFSKAYKIATQYTFPLIISSRFYDLSLESDLATFVIINPEGWFITAAHVLEGLKLHQQHQHEISTFQNSNSADLLGNPKWIINHSLWFAADVHRVIEFHILPENDLAIGRIENYNPQFVKNYPIFKHPKNIEPGTSLCKLGYPFYGLKAKFLDSSQRFSFDSSMFPIPSFPIDGMMTRSVVTGKSPDNRYDYKWIETSSPGLKGQSGGPTFDKEGKIWAIQSKTMHLPLGFSPKIIKNEVEIEENQFMNVGLGAHVETILKFLDFYNVYYEMEL
jgi:hypothetical protein